MAVVLKKRSRGGEVGGASPPRLAAVCLSHFAPQCNPNCTLSPTSVQIAARFDPERPRLRRSGGEAGARRSRSQRKRACDPPRCTRPCSRGPVPSEPPASVLSADQRAVVASSACQRPRYQQHDAGHEQQRDRQLNLRRGAPARHARAALAAVSANVCGKRGERRAPTANRGARRGGAPQPEPCRRSGQRAYEPLERLGARHPERDSGREGREARRQAGRDGDRRPPRSPASAQGPPRRRPAADRRSRVAPPRAVEHARVVAAGARDPVQRTRPRPGD